MRLSDLAIALGANNHDLDIDISGIAYDSRKVKQGDVFFAVSGGEYDGHDFIEQAVNKGASAIVCERCVPGVEAGAAQIYVADSRAALAIASDYFFGRPSRKLKIAGVTGTNGKTTTAYLLEAIFRAAGFKTGLIGTIEYRIGDRPVGATRTTPESLDLQELLADMVGHGVEVVIMEVSSHALELNRIDGCVFAGRVFINLSRDHLDYHKTMESYFLAKARLFTDITLGEGPKLANVDDSYGRRLIDLAGQGVISYGLGRGTYRAENVKLSPKETAMDLTYPGGRLALRSRLIGDFNVTNITAAASTALEMGVEAHDIETGIWSLDNVPGRFEPVSEENGFAVLVDYAHTPDGLQKVLIAAKALAGEGRLITVFGCGGNRDKGKRPRMGAIAARISDIAIVTSDNPRNELPEEIIKDIWAGIPGESLDKCRRIVDRQEAIESAIKTARRGDVVVLAGKGHESYQIVGETALPFSDKDMVVKAIEEL